MKRQKLMITAIVMAVAGVVAAFGFRKESSVSTSLPFQLVNSDNQPVAFSEFKETSNWLSIHDHLDNNFSILII